MVKNLIGNFDPPICPDDPLRLGVYSSYRMTRKSGQVVHDSSDILVRIRSVDGPEFSQTTCVQEPMDGGSERFV